MSALPFLLFTVALRLFYVASFLLPEQRELFVEKTKRSILYWRNVRIAFFIRCC
jgi:hypothetical protein